MMTLATTLRRSGPFVGVAAALAYAWLISGTRPFTTTATVVTAVPVVLGLAVAVARRGRRQPFRAWRAASRDAYERSLRPATRPKVAAGVAGWAVVIGLIVVWELVNLFQLPRDDHPTISWATDLLTEYRPGRLALALLWLALGVEVLRR
jgi:hypothetical protein